MNDVLTKNRKSHDLGKASEKTPEARRTWFDKLTMTWLTMTGREPALSLPKGRRKIERSREPAPAKAGGLFTVPSRSAFL